MWRIVWLSLLLALSIDGKQLKHDKTSKEIERILSKEFSKEERKGDCDQMKEIRNLLEDINNQLKELRNEKCDQTDEDYKAKGFTLVRTEMALCQLQVWAESSISSGSSSRSKLIRDCFGDDNCVGIYQDPQSKTWNQLTLPMQNPIGRGFHEENCNTQSPMIGAEWSLHLVRERWEAKKGSLYCKESVFTNAGVLGSNVRYYMDNTNQINFEAANAYCAGLGAKLVEIESAVELQTIAAFNKNYLVWIGAHRNANAAATDRSVWNWIYSNAPATQPWLWAPGQPDGDGWAADLLNNQFNDVNDDRTTPFICECQNPIYKMMDD
jgi:hypothetical protein